MSGLTSFVLVFILGIVQQTHGTSPAFPPREKEGFARNIQTSKQTGPSQITVGGPGYPRTDDVSLGMGLGVPADESDETFVNGDLSDIARNIQTSLETGPTQAIVGDADLDVSYPRAGDVSFGMDFGDPADGSSGISIGVVEPSRNVFLRLSRALKSCFKNSTLFRTFFNTGRSKSFIINLSSELKDFLTGHGFDYQTSMKLKTAVRNAISNIPDGSHSSVYARELARYLSTELSSSGKVSDANLNQIAPKIAIGFVKELSSRAPKYGIDLSGINVENELFDLRRNILTSLQTGPSQISVGGPSTDLGLSGSLLQSSLSGETLGIDISSLLSSSKGLLSPQAISRVIRLASSSVVGALGPNGLDVTKFVSGLNSSLSHLTGTGLSKNEAAVEGLVESLAALVHVLKSAELNQVDFSSIASTTREIGSAFSSLLKGI